MPRFQPQLTAAMARLSLFLNERQVMFQWMQTLILISSSVKQAAEPKLQHVREGVPGSQADGG